MYKEDRKTSRQREHQLPLLAPSDGIRRSLSPHRPPSRSPLPSPTHPPPNLLPTDFIERRRTWQLRSSSTGGSLDHPPTCCSSSAPVAADGRSVSNPFSNSSSAAGAVKHQSMSVIDKRKVMKLSPVARRRNSAGPPTASLAVGCGGRCKQTPGSSSCWSPHMDSGSFKDTTKRRPSRVVEEVGWLGLPPSPVASSQLIPTTPPPTAPSSSSQGTTERRMRTYRLRKMFSESTSSTSTEDHPASPHSRSAVSAESEERNCDYDEKEVGQRKEEQEGKEGEVEPTLDLCSPDVASSSGELELSSVQHQRADKLFKGATDFSFDDQIKGSSPAQSNADLSSELQRIARATCQNAVEDSAFEHETRVPNTSSEQAKFPAT